MEVVAAAMAAAAVATAVVPPPTTVNVLGKRLQLTKTQEPFPNLAFKPLVSQVSQCYVGRQHFFQSFIHIPCMFCHFGNKPHICFAAGLSSVT